MTTFVCLRARGMGPLTKMCDYLYFIKAQIAVIPLVTLFKDIARVYYSTIDIL